jgi:hypothetical protein
MTQIHPLRRDIALAPDPATRTKAPTRYSVRKFRDLDTYCRETPRWRIALVLVLTPVPGLLAAVLPAFVPLQAPQLGYNVAFFCHAALVDVTAAIGIMVTWISVTDVPRHIYSLQEAVLVSVLNAGLHVPLLYATARCWRYPIPFSWVLFAGVFLATLGVAHLVVLRSKLWRHRELIAAVRVYAASMLFQSAQILLYPVFTVLFDNVSATWRIVLLLVFPLIKLGIKHTLERLARGLRDHANEVVVCGVEMCASLYQSTILQTSPTPASIAIIMGIDFVQGMAVVKWFLDRHAATSVASLSGERIMDAARLLSRHYRVHSRVQTHRVLLLPNHGHAEDSTSSDMASATASDVATTTSPTASVVTTVLTLRGDHPLAVTRSDAKQILQHALETVFATQEVLLVEYIEVMVPFLHSLFLVLTARLPTAQFNPRLMGFYASDWSVLFKAVVSIWLYSLLQAASLVGLHYTLQRRYGISGVRQLAFVLERHRTSIVGKLMVWPPFILHFTLVQYGASCCV